jgi:hypothetical protein
MLKSGHRFGRQRESQRRHRQHHPYFAHLRSQRLTAPPVRIARMNVAFLLALIFLVACASEKTPTQLSPQRRAADMAPDGSFYLGKTPSTVTIAIPATAPREPEQVNLHVEGMTSENEQSPMYDVYLNVPPGEDPAKHGELFAEVVTTFGLWESSRERGSGQSHTLDVTKVYRRLSAAGWDGKKLRVTFVARKWDGVPKVRVERVRVTFK